MQKEGFLQVFKEKSLIKYCKMLLYLNRPPFLFYSPIFLYFFWSPIQIKQKIIIKMSVKNIMYTFLHPLKHNQYQSYNRPTYQMLLQDREDKTTLQNHSESRESTDQNSLKSEQNSLDQEIRVLQQKQNQLLSILNKTAEQYGQIYKEYLALIQNQSQQIQEEYERAQSNIYFLENQIEKLTNNCQDKNKQKPILLQKIGQFDLKRKQLKQCLDNESFALNKMIKSNKRKQNQIKIQRQIYLKLQEQIFNLDIQNQNLKKYGFQQIPPELSLFVKQKQQYRKTIAETNERTDYLNKQINKMIKKQFLFKIQSQNRINKEKFQAIEHLKEDNLLLKKSNKQLHDIQYTCQSNPNHQINHLENNIKETNSKIADLEKQNFNLNKKNHQTIKRTEYLNKKKQGQEQFLVESLKIENSKKQQASSTKRHKNLIKKDKQIKSKLFNQIKHDLQVKTNDDSSVNKPRLDNQNPRIKNTGIVWLNDNQFKMKIKSKKLKVLYMTIILIFLALFTCKK